MPDTPEPIPTALAPLVVDAAELESLEDAAYVHADLVAIADVVNGATREVRDRLEALAFADAGTGGVTRRYDVGQVIVTDPKPKPKITDPDAFEAWVELATDLETTRRSRVDVLDADDALAILEGLADALRAPTPDGSPPASVALSHDAATTLLGSVSYGTETLVPATAIDDLVKSGRVKITSAGAIDTDTGEAVPGVSVTTAARAVQVKPDKATREAAAAAVRARFAGRELEA